MNSTSKAPLSAGARIFLVVAAIISAVHMADYIFYGFEVRHLVAAVGFGLMSYGIYKNGFGKASAVSGGAVALDQGGRYATIVGTLLAFASIAMKYAT